MATVLREVIDRNYRQLSTQLFGEPVKQYFGLPKLKDFFGGPSVDVRKNLLKRKLKLVDDDEEKQQQWCTGKISQEKKRKHDGPLGRCLVCYSLVDREDRRNFLGKPNNSMLPRRIKEQGEDLMELLKLLAYSSTGVFSDESNSEDKILFETSIKRLAIRPWCLCGTCNSACQQLLWRHRVLQNIKMLEQQAKELQQKIICAIKLSTSFAEKDPNAKLDTICDLVNEEGKQLFDKRGAIVLRMTTVDRVRRVLTGGSWSFDKRRRMKKPSDLNQKTCDISDARHEDKFFLRVGENYAGKVDAPADIVKVEPLQADSTATEDATPPLEFTCSPPPPPQDDDDDDMGHDGTSFKITAEDKLVEDNNSSSSSSDEKKDRGITNHFPSNLKEPPEKLAMTPAAIRYHQLRTQYPHMSQIELRAHLKGSTTKKRFSGGVVVTKTEVDATATVENGHAPPELTSMSQDFSEDEQNHDSREDPDFIPPAPRCHRIRERKG